MNEVNSDIVVLIETFLRQKKGTRVQGYKSYTCNRDNKPGIDMLVKREMEIVGRCWMLKKGPAAGVFGLLLMFR